jgi:hypothetical protein
VHSAPPGPDSSVELVVELALLRIGVMAYPPGSATSGRILADMERELRSNAHRVAAMLAICSGDSTTLTPYQLVDATATNAMLLVWNESDGSDAVASAVGVVAQSLTGEAPSST